MDFIGTAEPLTLAGLRQAANLIRCDAAAVLAVIDVETSGCGFLPDRRPQILFERHIFHRETGGAFDFPAPDISSPVPGGYGAAGAAQYDRLAKAMRIDRNAAMRSTSWGIGQIMGFNSTLVGYSDTDAMAADFANSEDAQLLAVAEFCRRRGLGDELREKRWADFAYVYNGPRHGQYNYAGKLAVAYERHANGPAIDMALRAAQVRLRFAKLYHARVDGIDGPATRAALAAAMIRGIDVGYPTV